MPARTLIVVYAKDIERVAVFYSRGLTRPIVEQEPGFVIVGDTEMEVAVVRMAGSLAKETEIAVPPRVREETPLKPSFLVADLKITREAVLAAGGGAKPLSAAWSWRGEIHLDAYDPEGNRVQLRAHQV